MTLRVSLVPGTRVEPIGEGWVAFSSASGETAFLNDESAAVVEVLEDGPFEPAEVHRRLAADSGLPVEELVRVIDESWRRLVEAGLVRLERRSR